MYNPDREHSRGIRKINVPRSSNASTEMNSDPYAQPVLRYSVLSAPIPFHSKCCISLSN